MRLLFLSSGTSTLHSHCLHPLWLHHPLAISANNLSPSRLEPSPPLPQMLIISWRLIWTGQTINIERVKTMQAAEWARGLESCYNTMRPQAIHLVKWNCQGRNKTRHVKCFWTHLVVYLYSKYMINKTIINDALIFGWNISKGCMT